MPSLYKALPLMILLCLLLHSLLPNINYSRPPLLFDFERSTEKPERTIIIALDSAIETVLIRTVEREDAKLGDATRRNQTLVRHMALSNFYSQYDSREWLCPLLVFVVTMSSNKSCALDPVSVSSINRATAICDCCRLALVVHSEHAQCAAVKTFADIVASRLPVVIFVGRMIGSEMWSLMGSRVQPTVVEHGVYEALVHGTVTVPFPEASECYSTVTGTAQAIVEVAARVAAGERIASQTTCSEMTDVKIANEIAFLTAARTQFPRSMPETSIMNAFDVKMVREVMDRLKVPLPSINSTGGEQQVQQDQQAGSLLLNGIIKEYITHGSQLVESFAGWQRGEAPHTPVVQVKCHVCGHGQLIGNVLRFGPGCGDSDNNATRHRCSTFHRCPVCGHVQRSIEYPEVSPPVASSTSWCSQYTLLPAMVARRKSKLTVVMDNDAVAVDQLQCNVSAKFTVTFESLTKWAQRGANDSIVIVMLTGPFRITQHVETLRRVMHSSLKLLHAVVPCPHDLNEVVQGKLVSVHRTFLSPLGFPSDDILTQDRFVTVLMVEILAARLQMSIDRITKVPYVDSECLLTMSHKSSDGHVESSSSPQQVTQKLISSEVRSAVSGSAMHPSLFLTQPHQIVLQQTRVDLSERWRTVLLRGVQGTGGVLFGVGRTLLRYLQLRDETVPLEYILDLSGAGTTNRESFQSASQIGWDAFVQMWTNHSSPCHTPWTAVISTLADKHLFSSMLERSGDSLSRGPCYRLLNLRVLVLFPKPMLTRWAGPAREITGSTFDQQFRLVPPQPHSNTFRIFETLLHADGKARASLLHDAPLHEGPGASFWTTNKTVPRKKVVLVTHVLNEEHFLPYWIVQHSPHFDRVVLIDYNSSDRTRELVYRFAPSSWSVARYARPAQFINVENDNDVLTEENRFPEWWKVSLTAMEHLVGLHFRAHLRSTQHPCHEVTLCAVGGDDPFEFPLSSVGLRRWVPLALQRRRVSVSLPRILHSYGKDFMGRYHRGRHLQLHNKICQRPRLPTLPFAVVMKFAYSPWPELQVRKDLIRSMVVNATNGAKHHQRSWNAWNRARREKRGKFRFSPLNLTSRDHLHNFRKAWQNEFLLTFEDRATNDNQSKYFTRFIV